MLQSGQNWNLFGYDMRQLFKHWRGAWRDFLWGDESPVKARLDETLKVTSDDGSVAYFHAGQRVASPDQIHAGEPTCEAVILPDTMVLLKTLVLPRAVESDIEDVMALEVTANSPFPENDTGNGWRIVSRSDESLSVQLAVVSLSAVMSYLGQHYSCHDVDAREVWASVGDAVIVLNGFGEKKRQRLYTRRLAKSAGMLGFAILLLIVIFGSSAGFKYLQLEQLRTSSSEIKTQASAAIKMREAIVSANETITAVNKLLSERPNPHFELARLSHLLGDDASLLQLSIVGLNMDVRGIADDASAVIQQLTDEPAYAQVTAPQAITKYFNTGQEQFFLNIELSADQGHSLLEESRAGASQ